MKTISFCQSLMAAGVLAAAMTFFGGCAGAEVGGAIEVGSGPDYYGPDYGAWSYGHRWDHDHDRDRVYHAPPVHVENDYHGPHLPDRPRAPAPPRAPHPVDHDHDHDHH